MLWRRTRQRSNQSNECQRCASRHTEKPRAFDRRNILETATAVADIRSSHPWAKDRASSSATPLNHPWLSPGTVDLSLQLRRQPTQTSARHKASAAAVVESLPLNTGIRINPCGSPALMPTNHSPINSVQLPRTHETPPSSTALWLQMGPVTSGSLEGRTMKSESVATDPICDAPMRWMHCFCYFCLVLSVPWSIFGTSGWIGLLLHFQVASGGAWLLEKILRRRRPLRKMA